MLPLLVLLHKMRSALSMPSAVRHASPQWHILLHLLPSIWLAVQITHLDFSRNVIGSAAATDLLECLFRCPLQTLVLQQCDLDAHATRGIAFLLDNSLTLSHLDLSWNRLGPDGTKVLAEALQFNQSLVHLDLGHNALGAAGGAYLGEVLYDNRCCLGWPFIPCATGVFDAIDCRRVDDVNVLICCQVLCMRLSLSTTSTLTCLARPALRQ